MLRKISELDLATLSYINNLGEEKYDLFWLAATHIATWIPLFLLMLYLIYKSFSRRDALVILLAIGITLGATLLFTEGVKELVMRLRPNNNAEINGILRIISSPPDYSFFSGHASNSMAVCTLIVFLLKRSLKWVYIFYLWPFVFAFSRLYMGVHYPSDIITGAAIGFIIGYMAYRITKRYLLTHNPAQGKSIPYRK